MADAPDQPTAAQQPEPAAAQQPEPAAAQQPEPSGPLQPDPAPSPQPDTADAPTRSSRWYPAPPRWARYVAVSLLAVLVSLVFGVTTASTQASLGPHNARYEVTTTSVITVDLGPLGTIQLESPLPLSLGATVTIEEIPEDLTSVGSVNTLDALAGDVQGYLQFFSGPAATVSYVAKALAQDAARRAGFALGTILVVGGLGYLVLGPARRRELGAPVARASWPVAAGVVVSLAVSGVVVAHRASTSLDAVGAQASAVFDGTALEGARITGRLAGVVETYGGQLVDVYRDNEDFYATADANLVTAWHERAEQIARQDAMLRANGVGGADRGLEDGGQDAGGARDGGGQAGGREDAAAQDGAAQDGEAQDGAADGTTQADPGADDTSAGDDATGDGTSGAAGTDAAATDRQPGSGTDPDGDPAGDPTTDPADDPTTDPADEPTDVPDEDVVTLLMVSDLHCNTGMSPLIRTAAELSGASVILNGGDTTINGTAVERFCVDSFVGAAPKGVAWVQADGNHDSAITSDQARDAGATVLDGSVVEVEGIRILGDSDPRETRFGQGSSSVAGESYQQAGERLAEVACAEKDPVDLLLIHTPPVGDPVLESGCVPIQLSGHKHVRYGPAVVGPGVRYVSSTTAGAVEGQATIGPLRGTAQMTVFRYDRERHVMLDYQVIAVHPDQSVEVGARLAFPLVPGATAGTSSTPQGPGGDGADGGVDTDPQAPGDGGTGDLGDPAEE